jgi:hypothetical protein
MKKPTLITAAVLIGIGLLLAAFGADLAGLGIILVWIAFWLLIPGSQMRRIGFGFLGAAVLAGGAAQLTEPPKPEPAAAASSPAPVMTPPEQRRGPTGTPEQQLTAALHKDVDPAASVSMRPGEEVYVQWPIHDNFTEGMIKTGAQSDMSKILRRVQESGVPFQAVRVEGTFPMSDVYGNSSRKVVVSALYSRQTLERIQWANFLATNIYKVADGIDLHPSFR